MEDRLTNVLIIIILVIVIGLGGVYAYKITGESILDIIKNEMQEDETDLVDVDVEDDLENEIENEILNQEESIERESITANISGNTEGSTTTTTSSASYNNKYYYNQLNSYSKAIYDAIEDNIDNLKSGSYTIYIDYDFSSLLDGENGEENLDGYYSDAINAINLDIPYLFYIDFTKLYLNIETTTSLFSTTYKLYLNAGNGGKYFSSGFSTQEEVEATINSVESIKNQIYASSTGTDYNKLKVIHDWLIDNLSYNSNVTNRSNIYGALVEKNAVCEGYARAYKYLLDELGITNILVVGTATNSSGETEDHMWNYVYLERLMVCS